MTKDLYKSAKKRVKLKKEFYHHLLSYLAVNIVMFFVVFFNSGGFSWLMPACFWGIGLLSHYFKAFGFPGVGVFDSEEWEENEIKKEIAKQKRKYERILEVEELELRELSKNYRTEDLV